MYPLTVAWASAYMSEHPGTLIQVTGGGSEGGFEALIDGEADLSAASRPMSGAELLALMRSTTIPPHYVLTARDALCLYSHPDNTIHSLSLADLRDIFSGRVRNWKEVGGDDAPIRLLRRNDASGTHTFFLDHVMRGQPIAGDAAIFPTTPAIIEEIARDPHAIGYGGIGYTKGIKPLRVDNIEASETNVRSGAYPLSRYLYLYARSKPAGETRRFVEWVQSPSGQRIVVRMGFIPLYTEAMVY
jgi:phosphate transport system substrate-binding protein